MRRVAVIAAELLTNAVRHALAERNGMMLVSLRRMDDELMLCVSDDGPGVRPEAAPSGTGWGRGIVAELVDAAGGAIHVETGPHGTSVSVVLPAVECGPRVDDDGCPF